MEAVEAKCRGCERSPESRWQLAWRWGRDSGRELAGGTGFHGARRPHAKNFFGSVVKRRGGQNNPLWRKTLTWDMARATHDRDHH